MNVHKPKSKIAAEVHEVVRITPPRINALPVTITGTAPFMSARMAAKTRANLLDKMTSEQVPGRKAKREARNLAEECEAAVHRSTDGWAGFPASAVRRAMISACRLVGFKMTFAKLSIFVPAQGFDEVDGLPLIQIFGSYEQNIMHVRNATGVIDFRVRPMWREWSAKFTVEYDSEQFSTSDVVNLLMRVGRQVGLGEGRPDSRDSPGLGFGLFDVVLGHDS